MSSRVSTGVGVFQKAITGGNVVQSVCDCVSLAEVDGVRLAPEESRNITKRIQVAHLL